MYNNNPKQILFANGNMTRYVYSAAGQKLRTIHYTSFSGKDKETSLADADEASVYLSVDTTDYVFDGMMEYSNGRFARLQFDGGLLWAKYMKSIHLAYPKQQPTPSSPVEATTTDQFDTMDLHLGFYYKDHLGNNRAVVDEQGKTLQTTDYYPYGMPYLLKRPSLLANQFPYKYNGKELDKMSGLNTYDYGGRQYYSAIPMWDRVDPLCEDDYHSSPYAYCLGRPTMLIDLDGYKPTMKEAALMAKHVYGKIDAEKAWTILKKTGWKVSKFNTKIRKDMNYTKWNENGLQTCLYERKKADGKIEYVYAYAGTNSIEDALEDIAQTIGLAPQYSWTVSNARKLSSELENAELTFVGHSLGGGEAAAASMATGRKAITFNRASVSKLTKKLLKLNKGEKNIENYQMSSDSLTLIQNKLSVGAKGKNKIIETDENFAHGIDSFIK